MLVVTKILLQLMIIPDFTLQAPESMVKLPPRPLLLLMLMLLLLRVTLLGSNPAVALPLFLHWQPQRHCIDLAAP
jgi:hypothetical protein